MLSKYLGAAIGVVDAVWLRWPVNGYVASLLVQLGDYATVGKNLLSLVDAHSFWVDANFEDSNFTAIHQADPATIKLVGNPQILRAMSTAALAPSASLMRSGIKWIWPRSTRSSLWVRLPYRWVADRSLALRLAK